MRAPLAALLAVTLAAAVPLAQTPASKTLDIYYVDTEGGQATLFVSPSGESLLVDAQHARSDAGPDLCLEGLGAHS